MIDSYQGEINAGALVWLKKAVECAKELGDLYGTEVWFTQNAHSFHDYTVTIAQMKENLDLCRMAGVWNIGWFTMDILKDRDKVVYFGRENASFDASQRYNYFTSMLLDKAKEPFPVESVSHLNILFVIIMILISSKKLITQG
jgi:hypothetical protein